MYFNTNGKSSMQKRAGFNGFKNRVTPKPSSKYLSPRKIITKFVKLTGSIFLIACVLVSARINAQVPSTLVRIDSPEIASKEIEKKAIYPSSVDITIPDRPRFVEKKRKIRHRGKRPKSNPTIINNYVTNNYISNPQPPAELPIARTLFIFGMGLFLILRFRVRQAAHTDPGNRWSSPMVWCAGLMIDVLEFLGPVCHGYDIFRFLWG